MLANALVDQGRAVVTSFAGVTRKPLLPKGEIHVGGFGGVEGLAQYLRSQSITHVVDATHPFAAQMSAHAHTACESAGLPLMRLERPAWTLVPGDTWIEALNMAEAARHVPSQACVLLTTGRKALDHFLARADLSGVIRTIEAPDRVLPARWHLLQDRPPHALEGEMSLMRRSNITCLVSKNAGGPTTIAKIHAARSLGIPVVMITRPAKPPGIIHATVAEALLGIMGRAG